MNVLHDNILDPLLSKLEQTSGYRLRKQAISAWNAASIADVMAAVQRCGSLGYSRAQAQRYHDQALALL